MINYSSLNTSNDSPHAANHSPFVSAPVPQSESRKMTALVPPVRWLSSSTASWRDSRGTSSGSPALVVGVAGWTVIVLGLLMEPLGEDIARYDES